MARPGCPRQCRYGQKISWSDLQHVLGVVKNIPNIPVWIKSFRSAFHQLKAEQTGCIGTVTLLCFFLGIAKCTLLVQSYEQELLLRLGYGKVGLGLEA